MTIRPAARCAATAIVLIAAIVAALPCQAALDGGVLLEVVLDGAPLAEYNALGTTYIEARAGAEYALRLRNTTDRRIAVALAVDGLNTIDAKSTTARRASKWVLGPRESVVIEGWQTDQRHARKFFFTTEDASYGAWLGATDNLGVIEAVVFREQCTRQEIADADTARKSARRPAGAAAPREAESGTAGDAGRLSDELAATGIGRRVDNPVRRVSLDLEPEPSAHLRIRYEYRPQLVALGVLPPPADPMHRREQARGFTDFEFCPDPNPGR